MSIEGIRDQGSAQLPQHFIKYFQLRGACYRLITLNPVQFILSLLGYDGF
jgi:hypothetical protein